MKKVLNLLIVLFLWAGSSWGQTTLIGSTNGGGFEQGGDFSSNSWILDNGSATSTQNQWCIGTSATAGIGSGNVAYITNNSATKPYAYTNNSAMYIVHFYRDVTFPAGETNINLSFTWKGVGETTAYDGLQVAIAPTSVTPVAASTAPSGSVSGTIVSGAQYIGNVMYFNQSTSQTATISIPAALAGNSTSSSTMRIIFTFRMDGSVGTSPATAIDDISLVTNFPLNFVSVQTGNWNDNNTWGTAAGVIPTAADNVTIADGHTVTINAASACLDLQVGQGPGGAGAFLQYETVTARTLTVTNNVNVYDGGTFRTGTSGSVVTHGLSIGGNLTVNGTFDMNVGTAGTVTTFTGATDASISGAGPTCDFYSIIVNKGTTNASVLDVTRVITMNAPAAAASRLTITNGTFKMSSASTLTPYFGGATICASTGRLWLNNASASITNVGVGTTTGAGIPTITGELRIDNGTFGYGGGANTATFTSGSGILRMSGGTLNIFGSVSFPSSAGTQFIMSGGNINVDPQAGANATTAAFSIGISTTVDWSGGTVTIIDPLAASGGVAFTASTGGTKTVTGGTLVFGNGVSTSTGGTTLNTSGFGFFSSMPLWDVVINSAMGVNSRQVRLSSSTTSIIKNSLTVNTGGYLFLGSSTTASTLNMQGNIINNGTIAGCEPTGTQTIGTLYFGGPAGVAQTITGSGVFTNLQNLAIDHLGTGVSSSISFKVRRINLFTGTLDPTNITIGNPSNATNENPIIQFGGGGATVASGTMSSAPTYDETEGQRTLMYSTMLGAAVMGSYNEIGTGASILTQLLLNDADGLTIPADRTISIGGALAGTLTMTLGSINLSGGTLTLGSSPTAAGTLSWSAGSIQNGTLTRWYPTTGLPTAAGTGIGFYPMGHLASNRQVQVFFSSATALSTGGTISVTHNNAGGQTAITPFVDGGVTVDSRTNANWAISSGNGIALTGTISLAVRGDNTMLPTTVADLRLIRATDAVGTSANGTGTPANPVANRTAMSLTDLDNTFYFGSTSANMTNVNMSVASGDWNNTSTWSLGTVPTCSEPVIIAGGYTVTVNSAGNNAKNVTIDLGCTLVVASGDLTVGCTLNNNFITNNGTLTVNDGTLYINGNLLNNAGSTFNQAGGNIIVDGNNGTTAESVATGIRIVSITASAVANLNLSGGTLTIVDPHLGTSTSDYALWISQGGASNNASTNHTVKFGDGVSTQAGGHTNGLYMYLYPGSYYYLLGNVEVDMLTGTNRFVKSNLTTGILGNLTINSGEYQLTSTHYIAGNVTNNGTLTSTSTLHFANYLGQTVNPSTNSQTISGTGEFRNSATTVTANLSSFTINNADSVSGVTIGVPLSLSGTLTLTKGIVNTTATNLLTLGTATTTGTLSGGSATAYINGPFIRRFLASRNATGTYSTTTLFPVGKNGTYLPVWIDPTTTAGGPILMSGEAFTTNPGDTCLSGGVSGLSTNRWEALIADGSANFTSSFLRLGDTSIVAGKLILQAPGATSDYCPIIPGTVFATGTPNTLTTTGSQILAANYTGYFAYGNVVDCTLPAEIPTNFTASLMTTTTFTASFTPPANPPSNYLVVRYPATTIPSATPVNYTNYAVGAALGNGTVRYAGTLPTFNETGLTLNTSYDYYVYSFNASGCYGPIYKADTALFGNITTCSATVGTPGTPFATNNSTSGFTANWSASTTPSVSYYLDVATNSTFTNYVPGYQYLNVGLGVLSYPVTGLQEGTPYYVRVRAVDGSACHSSVSSTLTITTLCNPLSVPFFEGFETGYTHNTKLEGCWVQQTIAGSATWTANNTLTTFNRTPRTGSWNAFLTTSNQDWMYIPLNLEADSCYIVELYARQDGTVPANAHITVMYGTGADTSYMDNSIIAQTGLVNGNYQLLTGTFTPSVTGAYYVGIKGLTASQYISIDDIKIEVCPDCFRPNTLSSYDVAGYQAKITWTNGGSESKWDIYYGPTATLTPPDGSTIPTVSGVTTKPYHITTGLVPSTAYTYYVRADCEGDGVSEWSLPNTFTTTVSCPAPTGLTTVSTTKNTATLDWTDLATAFDIEYGVAPYSFTGIPQITNVAKPATLINLLPETEYQYKVRAVCAPADTSLWSATGTFTTLCDYPDFVSTTPDTICGYGNATLGATVSTGGVNWYANETGGMPLDTNTTSFVTPFINTTTTFYAASTSGGTGVVSVGAPYNGQTTTYTLQAGLLFDVYTPVTLQGVYVYPIGTGPGVINVALKTDGGTILNSLAFNTTGTASPGIKTYIPLNWDIPAGTQYWLDMPSYSGSITGLIRDPSASIIGGPIATNPYMTIPGVMTITSGRLTASGTSTSYYYFFDWQIGSGCESPRVPVVATVTPAPAFAITADQAVCDTLVKTLTVVTGQSDFDSFIWSPQTNLYTDATAQTPYTGGSAATVYFKTTTPGATIYTCEASSSVSSCFTSATTTVTYMNDLDLSTFAITPQSNCTSLNLITVTPGSYPFVTLYSNDFTSATLDPAEAGLFGNNSSITGGQLILTDTLASKNGAIQVLNPDAVNANAWEIEFDMSFQGSSTGNADGISYSFGDDVVPIPTSPNPENGSGTKFKVSFDSYGSGTAGKKGIYLMYNCNVLNQTPTTTGVLAYSENAPFVDTTNQVTTHVKIVIDPLGYASLLLDDSVVFSNIALPAAYLAADKSTWKHVISSRTGAIYESHIIDNLSIKYSNSTDFFEYSNDNTNWQTSNVFSVDPGTYPISIRLTANPSCSANLGDAVVNTPVYTLVASSDTLCAHNLSGISLLSFNPAFTGAAYRWEKYNTGTSQWDTIAGAVNATYTVLASDLAGNTDYRCRIYCDSVEVIGSPSVAKTVYLANPVITSTTPDTRCGTGTVDLSATASGGTVLWYSSPGGGTPIGTGDNFTTPIISTTTSYYVGASSGGAGVAVNEGLSAVATHSGGGASPDYGPNLYNDGLIPAYSATGTGIWGWTTTNGWIEFTWPTAKVFTKVVFHKGNRPMSTCTFQYWNGSAYVDFYNYNSSVPEVDSVSFPAVSSTKIRFNGIAGSSNPNFREIQVFAQLACISPLEEVVAVVEPAPELEVTSTQTICANAVFMLRPTIGLDDYDQFTWDPVTDLFTDLLCTTPYTGTNSDTVYLKSPTGGIKTYTLTAFNTSTECQEIVSTDVIVIDPDASIISSPEALCISGDATLEIEPATGYGTGTFQWQISTDGINYTNIPDADSTVYETGLIDTTTFYQINIFDGSGNTCVTPQFTLVVNDPQILTTTPASRCGIGTVTLEATSNVSTINWYGQASGGAIIGNGGSFVTPVINATDTFYVSANAGAGGTEFVGPYDNTIGTTSTYANTTYYLYFDVLEPQGVTIFSIDVFPSTAPGAAFSIQLLDNVGTVLQTYSGVTTVASGQREIVPVNFAVPYGQNYRVKFGVSGGFWRNTTGATFPYTIPGVLSINGNSFSGYPQYYYWFYNWQVSTGCESARQPVIATVTPAPEILPTALPATVCAGSNVALNVTSTNDPNYTYLWTGGLSGASHTVTPTTSATYSVTATDNTAGPNSGCVNTGSVSVSVNPVPAAVIVTPSSGYTGSITELVATGGTIGGEFDLGTDVTTTSTAGITPFTSYWEGARIQYMILASEITAYGINAGTLNSIGFDVTAAGPGTYPQLGYTMKIAHTTDNEFAGGYANNTSGWTTVYTNASEPAPAVGWKIFNFSTPFVWDGVSNVVIDICHENDPTGTCSACYSTSSTVRYTATTFNSVYGRYNDNLPACDVLPTSAISTFTNRPNMRINGTTLAPITWSPTTGLYTDDQATIPYTGGATDTVYANPTVGTTYTATATNTFGCTSSGQAVILESSKTLNMNVLLEGLYNPGSDVLNPAKDYIGGIFVDKWPAGIADKVTVELHNSSAPYATAYTYTNVDLNTNGTLSITTIPSSITGSYYIVVKHRNSIETWSSTAIDFTQASPISYNFTTSSGQAFGSNQKLMGSRYVIFGGNPIQDDNVEAGDVALLDNAVTSLMKGYVAEDLNGDGQVDASDVALLDNNVTALVKVKRPQ